MTSTSLFLSTSKVSANQNPFRLTQEGLWKNVLGDATGAPAPKATPAPTAASAAKGKGKEVVEKPQPVKEGASFLFKRKFLK